VIYREQHPSQHKRRALAKARIAPCQRSFRLAVRRQGPGNVTAGGALLPGASAHSQRARNTADVSVNAATVTRTFLAPAARSAMSYETRFSSAISFV